MTFISIRSILYVILSVICISFLVFCDTSETQTDSTNNLKNSLSANIEIQEESDVEEVPGVQDEISNLYPFKLIDSSDQTIEFTEAPNRIIAFDSAALETIFELGEGDKIVGTHDFVSYPPEAEKITRVGGAFNMNIEAIVGLNPDLVFVFSDQNLNDLKNAGLKVLYIESLNNDFIKISDEIRMWGRILDAEDKAEDIISDFEKRLYNIQDAVKNIDIKQSIFQDVGDLWTPGPNTLVGEVFTFLNSTNIAFDVDGYEQISREIIVDRNPDVILTSDIDSITKDPAFIEINAVVNNRVYILPSDALSIGGPRFIDGIEELALLIYQESISSFLPTK